MDFCGNGGQGENCSTFSADLDYLQSEVPKAFEQTMGGVERVTKLVLGLKGFAHDGTDKVKHPAAINEIIRNSLIVCHNAYKYGAEMETFLRIAVKLFSGV